MFLDAISNRVFAHGEKTCIVWNGKAYTYAWLQDHLSAHRALFVESGIEQGTVTAIHADFSPSAVAAILALFDIGAIVVPVSPAVTNPESYHRVATVEIKVSIDNSTGEPSVQPVDCVPDHEILVSLKKNGHPGLILFSSGSTGEPKAAVHDMLPLIERYERPGKVYKAISFLLFDHIGGINTMLAVVSNNGTLVVPASRDPEHIADLIEEYSVELLPTSPTFLNLLLMANVVQGRNLRSLKMITYGTEAMPENLLKRLNAELPWVKFKQTYGLSELGIMRTQSRSNDSLWIKVGGEDYETKIVDGNLWIRSRTAMLGYLNAPAPFDEEGWFNTQDKVEVDGEWIKILGRDSDLINVGGLKVYPAEVESAIMGIPDVQFVSVYGKANPIVGTAVAASVSFNQSMSNAEAKKIIRKALKGSLEDYKIPAYVFVQERASVSSRFKKQRIDQ